MLTTLLDLVRELTETLDNTSNDLEGEAQALVNALLGRAKAALDQADQARLGEFAGKPVGLPECGACPGDGTVCVAACKLQGESPKAEPAHGWHWMSHPSWNSGEPIPVWVFDEDGKLFYRPFADLSTDFEWDRRDPEWRSHGRLAVEQAEA